MEIDEKLFIINFGKRLREIRISKNLSQEIVANDCNIPINQIGRIERAEINTSIITIYKIAKALDIKIQDLLNFE
ncbi:helix-turn-helix domain-containing protein [Flavobacterium sp.]|uniref:helix-turn-helix domain-containing protein n=1 Tax=Flavobacterium sp. TaxID=239 RepID=UPI0037534F70